MNPRTLRAGFHMVIQAYTKLLITADTLFGHIV